MNNEVSAKGLEATLKSTDTEEWIDLLFYRPIGYRWALLFRRLGVTPNAITIASIFLGIAAGILFYYNDLLINIIGMCLLVWANMYDSADGQLARMTGQKSEIGRILDGVSGDFWFISIYVAICLRLTPEWGYWNVHLFFLKGKSGSELDNSVQQRELYLSLSWKKDLVRKTFLWFYTGYTHSQEQFSPAFQRFFAALRAKYSEVYPQEVRNRFREGSLPLMKYTNILSFNTRVIVLFISLLVNLPWIYFVFELTVLNGLLIYMICQHERLCRQMYQNL